MPFYIITRKYPFHLSDTGKQIIRANDERQARHIAYDFTHDSIWLNPEETTVRVKPDRSLEQMLNSDEYGLFT